MTTRPRLLISGISGLLGLNAAFQWRERFDLAGCYLTHPVVVPGAEAIRLDLEDKASLRALVSRFSPSIILHTAGLTNVDRCELEPAYAERLNVEVARNVAEAARSAKARLVHISTDHLFSGAEPFCREESEPEPINSYARTKLHAEQVVARLCPDALIVRTNFLGWGTSIRSSLTDWILSSLAEGKSLNMFTDVFTTPILVNDLLDCILDLVDRNVRGVVNVAGAQRISKYDIGTCVANSFGYSTDLIRPISVENFPFAAPRPRDMSLATERVSALLNRPMPDVDAAISKLHELQERGLPGALEDAVRKAHT